MRVKQGYLVLAIVVGALLGLAVFASLKMGRSHYKAMVLALEHGLEKVYDRAVSRSPATGPQKSQWVSSEILRNSIIEADKQAPPRPIFPSFVNPSDVFLPVQGVTIPSAELVCVVQMDSGQLYGITGERACREISKNEFRGWPHQILSSRVAGTNSAGVGEK
jgi:hypothetical protein